MTTELEQEFYKVFGIKPEFGYWCKIFDETNIADCNGIKEPSNKCAKCENGYIKYKFYPVITAEKLLEMICILNSYYTRTMQCCTMLYSSSIATLKEEILKEFIDILKQYTELDFLEKDRDEREEEDWIKHQIQQLFKEDI